MTLLQDGKNEQMNIRITVQ